MVTLHIEHPVRDFDTWKSAFDGDPIRRERGGVRRYRVFRPLDDMRYILVDLEFDDLIAATAFQAALQELWRSPQAANALGGTPQARILDVVEDVAL